MFASLVPYWAKILFFIPEDTNHKIKRDFRILKENLLRLVFFPKFILGLPQRRSTAQQHAELHEMGDWKRILGYISYALITSIYSLILGVIASIPVICSFYGIIDRLLCEIGVEEPTSTHPNATPEEKWFFINGICTSKANALKNREMISLTFGNRPVTLLHNPTEGMLLDLIECIIGRTLNSRTNVSQKAYKEIERALRDANHRRVVLIGHSQGCIIASNVLELLRKDFNQGVIGLNQIQKLEVFTFGSPADTMDDCNGKVYCEHFVNDYDVVPRFGIMDRDINYQTERVFYGRKKSGHFLNQHYLNGFDTRPYQSRSGYTPRLYSYI